MLASAAIPVFFEAQNFAGDLYVDGGLRQIAPVSAAAAMGANEIYTVVSPIPLRPLRADEQLSGLFDIGSRAATDITIDEITSENIDHFGGWGFPVPLIRPDTEIEDSRTIDPGLIRINMAYGYMRAYEVASPRAVANPELQAALRKLSKEIADKRLEIWRLEEDAFDLWRHVVFLNSQAKVDFENDMEKIRSAKNELMGLVECRASILPASLPDGAEDWALSWEAHQVDPTNMNLPNDLPNLPPSPWDGIDLPAIIELDAGAPTPTPPPDGCPSFS
jgi:hypothetical protein